MQLQEGSSDFIALSRGYDGTSLIHLAPMESVRYMLDGDEVFMHVESDAVTKFDPEIAGQRIALMWEIGEDEGWILTNEGLIAEIYPTESRESLGIMETIVFATCSNLRTGRHHRTHLHEQQLSSAKIQATAWL